VRLLDVDTVTELHPGIKPGTLREWIFYADSNGFRRAIRRVKRKVLIVEEEMLAWIDEQSGVSPEIAEPPQGERANS
jgi:hypothetical protein